LCGPCSWWARPAAQKPAGGRWGVAHGFRGRRVSRSLACWTWSLADGKCGAAGKRASAGSPAVCGHGYFAGGSPGTRHAVGPGLLSGPARGVASDCWTSR
jgi:hypothetical protein